MPVVVCGRRDETVPEAYCGCLLVRNQDIRKQKRVTHLRDLDTTLS